MITRHDVPSTFFDHYPGMTQCNNCDGLIPRLRAVQEEGDDYCSQACVREARKSGLIKRKPVRRT